MSDRNFKWYWGYGEQPEDFYGPEDSRDDILQVARNECDGQAFSIVEADKELPGTGIFDAGNVLQEYEDQNEECWGEDGPDIHPTREQELELEASLTAVLTAWMDKHKLHGSAWAFGTQRNHEFFPAEDAAEEPKP